MLLTPPRYFLLEFSADRDANLVFVKIQPSHRIYPANLPQVPAVCCKSIFDNAGIAAVVFERRARGWRDVRRAKLAEAGVRRFFFFRAVAARRRCRRQAEATRGVIAWRSRAYHAPPSQRTRPTPSFNRR